MNFSNCPLYNLQSKKKLSKLLLFKNSISVLKNMCSPRNYIVRPKVRKNKHGQIKIRYIQEPKEQLKTVHNRVAKLLKKLELPVYLHSGRKHHSYKTNAEKHRKLDYVLNIDIEKYFPSCRAESINKFFKEKLNMSPDVAYLLTGICTYAHYVPTGSPLSQLIAFCASYEMFEDIYDYCISNGLTMTVYVDDLTISASHPIVKTDVRDILNIIEGYGFKHKKQKLRYFPKGKSKEITGTVICKNKIRTPHKLKKIIFDQLDSLKGSTVPNASLIGRITEVQYLERKTELEHLLLKLRKAS